MLMLILLFSIVRKVISVSSVKFQVTRFQKIWKFSKNLKIVEVVEVSWGCWGRWGRWGHPYYSLRSLSKLKSSKSVIFCQLITHIDPPTKKKKEKLFISRCHFKRIAYCMKGASRRFTHYLVIGVLRFLIYQSIKKVSIHFSLWEAGSFIEFW